MGGGDQTRGHHERADAQGWEQRMMEGVREEQEPNKRDSKPQPADCCSIAHVNEGSGVEKSTGEKQGGEGPPGMREEAKP